MSTNCRQGTSPVEMVRAVKASTEASLRTKTFNSVTPAPEPSRSVPGTPQRSLSTVFAHPISVDGQRWTEHERVPVLPLHCCDALARRQGSPDNPIDPTCRLTPRLESAACGLRHRDQWYGCCASGGGRRQQLGRNQQACCHRRLRSARLKERRVRTSTQSMEKLYCFMTAASSRSSVPE